MSSPMNSEMNLPLLGHPLEEPSAFTPEALMSAVQAERGLTALRVPPVCLLEFDGDLTDSLVSSGRAQRWTTWACFHTAMFAIESEGVPLGIVPRTIGGPYAVLIAKQLAAAGVRLILGLTSAGRVSPSISIPSFVVATEAVRDEGTSFHYLPPSPRVTATRAVIPHLEAELRFRGFPVSKGPVWTTDAPYRETRPQLSRYADEGILAVEMQAASLFAFSAARKVPVGVVAHITNSVDHSIEPFKKASRPEDAALLKALCSAGRRILESQ
jgi:uridine phosphorylase